MPVECVVFGELNGEESNNVDYIGLLESNKVTVGGELHFFARFKRDFIEQAQLFGVNVVKPD